MAIREALLQAASRNITHICIRTDSQVFVRAISSRRKTTDLYGVLVDIDDLAFSSSSPFVSCRFVFVSRIDNGLADGFAKVSLSTHSATNLFDV